MIPHLIFDIETGPLPEAVVEALLPPLDVLQRKTREIDPKLAAEAWMSKAELRGLTGDVRAIGFLDSEHQPVILLQTQSASGLPPIFETAKRVKCPFPGIKLVLNTLPECPIRVLAFATEAAMIDAFWAIVQDDTCKLPRIAGFGIKNFDLPFLFQRSAVQGVRVPRIRHSGKWSDRVVDLKEIWTAGSMWGTGEGSLDQICRAMGGPGKCDRGERFASLLSSQNPKENERALTYLVRDLTMTLHIFKAMNTAGLIHT